MVVERDGKQIYLLLADPELLTWGGGEIFQALMPVLQSKQNLL